MSLELDIQIGIVRELQEHVHHVSGDESLPLALPTLVVLVQHVLQEPVKLFAYLLHPPDVALQV
ncbi:hypothetical protein C4D60_Mb05t25870 [Musa balbisiana]|uniref:Uncharacterized protein n=1 Tax=Musa balbisiana TaxID=52838 RepID=A0A4S8JYY5_MUSBA|nr:hypothetical protein C4D60_Mb05t25870 [Musa balbisiana]